MFRNLLDRMRSRKNRVDLRCKIPIGYANLNMRESRADLIAEFAFSLTLMHPTNIMSLWGISKTKHYHITIPIKGCPSLDTRK